MNNLIDDILGCKNYNNIVITKNLEMQKLQQYSINKNLKIFVFHIAVCSYLYGDRC